MTMPPSEGGSHVRLLLGAYVLGALCAEEDRTVAEHLRHCEECGAAYLEMTEAQNLLALFSEADLLDGLDDHLEEGEEI
ncbi:zf-HC2 domain-containing protein [Streptomyces sp. NPDC057271]|uniref:zf-HC2 domain-containing protein n=1 Tax=unclassified Streptomyces TaxID=2593676 RepID=UPI00363D8B34